MHCATMHGMQLAAGVMQYSRRFSAEDGAMDSRLAMAHMLDLFFPFLANRKGVCRLGGGGGEKPAINEYDGGQLAIGVTRISREGVVGD